MHLSQKIPFVKSEGLCENCLIKHSGECEFHNRHTCRETDAKKHHSYLCPDKSKEKVIGGVTWAENGLEEGNLYAQLNVIEFLNIDPYEWSRFNTCSMEIENDGGGYHIGGLT